MALPKGIDPSTSPRQGDVIASSPRERECAYPPHRWRSAHGRGTGNRTQFSRLRAECIATYALPPRVGRQGIEPRVPTFADAWSTATCPTMEHATQGLVVAGPTANRGRPPQDLFILVYVFSCQVASRLETFKNTPKTWHRCQESNPDRRFWRPLRRRGSPIGDLLGSYFSGLPFSGTWVHLCQRMPGWQSSRLPVIGDCPKGRVA